MTKFLLDANLSPQTRVHLVKKLGLDVIDLLTENQGALRDEEVVAFAKQQQRVLITFDLDFGEIYHFREKGKLGVIILRLEDQTVESVNSVLDSFFAREASNIDLEHSLVVVAEDRIRIVVAE